MRRWAAASLLVVASLYARVTGQWAITALTVVLLLAALAFGARLALTVNAARIAVAVAAAAGGVLGWLVPPLDGQPLRGPWPAFVLAGLFAGAAALCHAPRGRPSAALMLPGLVALTACGEAAIGRLYVVFAVAHLGLALLALRSGDEGRPTLRAFPRRRAALGLAVLGVTAAVALVTARVLPPLSMWTEARVLRALGGAESGFSDRLWLGSLDGMLQSDEVVMRIEGPRTDYLRGAVYDHYEIGRWGRLHPARKVPVTAASAPSGGDRVRATIVSGARDRYFLPLGAHAVATSDGALVADRYGVLHTGGERAPEVSWSEEGAPDYPVAEPGEDDLVVPANLRVTLSRLAAFWTVGATTPEEKVNAIAARLRTFKYSLRYEHNRRRDPLLDFLYDDQQGHCEYFASALTLLVRSLGVPARVAVGYRVTEQNALGGYWVVRERDAHAWSEVFLEGKGFVTVDATPAGGVAEPHQAGLLGAIRDVIAAWIGRVWARITLLDMVGVLVAVIAVGLLVRRLMQRRGPSQARARKAVLARPPPSVERLLDALARRGAVRAASEPLERFAARLPDQSPALAPAADLIERWAAYRYGGLGDGEALLREIDDCASILGRSR